MSQRILHIAHQQLRRYGATRVSWARKLDLGMIKAGYDVHNFSDRDVAAFEAPFGYRPLGVKRANRRLLETVENLQPDLIIAGHCDSISNETLTQARALCPNAALIHCNNDPLFVPSNAERIESRLQVCDAGFVSTGRRTLATTYPKLIDRLWHMPNPVDESIERFDASSNPDVDTDLIFCSKSTDVTDRLSMVGYLREQLDGKLRFRTPGSYGEPGVWGRQYDEALAASRMGLNINRQEGDYWYSSARMAQLGGNGVLVFSHASNGFHELFPEDTLAYYNDAEELLAGVLRFHADDDARKTWAANTRRFFHERLNSRLYASYIVETALGLPHSHDYVWQEAL